MASLRCLGYVVNEDLQLRHVKTGKPFKFINQAHYERLADAVAEYIQELMVEKYGMERLELPFKELKETKVQVGSEATCPVFLSSNAYTTKTLLILLCGTGRVMAGQWARRLCINDSFHTGSVLPFLEWAQENDMAVLVLNPNENLEQGMMRNLFNHSSTAHVIYAWDNICTHLPADHIAMVAHSYGGVNTCELLEHRGSEVLQRLRCVAFTDSVHSSSCIKSLPVRQQHFLIHSCINWASSCQPLDTVLSEASPSESFFLKVQKQKKLAHHNHQEVPETGNSQKETWHDRGQEAAARDYSPAAGTSVQVSSGGSHSKGMAVEEEHEIRLQQREQIDWKSQEQDFIKKPKVRKQLLDSDSDSTCDFKGMGMKKKKYDYCCKQVSAGIDVHEETTMKAFNSVCQFILEKIKSAEQNASAEGAVNLQ